MNRSASPHVCTGERTAGLAGSEVTAISDHDAQLLRALHDEHADALYAHALRLVNGDRHAGRGPGAGDAAAGLAAPRVAGPDARLGPGLAVHHRAQPGHRRLAAAVDPGRRGVHRRAARAAETVDEAERAVEAWTVAEALNRLSPTHREVLVECFYQGRSVAEAAARLGVPPGTVKSRTHYALRSLRLALAEMGVTG